MDAVGLPSHASSVVSALVPADGGKITLSNIYWSGPVVGWKLYAGLDPNSLSLQVSGSGVPLDVSFTDYIVAGEGVPDTQFDHLDIKVKNIAYQGGGIFGFSV